MASWFGRAKNGSSKTVIVGLDGVPYTLLKNLIDVGRIPNMRSIFEEGYFGRMDASIPEISSVSWSSFMTGTQAGEHGIYGFMDLKPGTYETYFPNFAHLKSPTFWDQSILGDRKAVVINMPATYPARPINGALISGFVAIDLNKAVFPNALLSPLKEKDYRIDLDTMKARNDYPFLFRDLEETLKSRGRAVDLLWEQIDWDLFIVVITGTDRLMHFLWEAYENEAHVYHRDFMDYFEKVDSFVGRIYERFNGNGERGANERHFYMLSDHGFTQIKTELYLNRWLQENGYLCFQSEKPTSVKEIGECSRAFALDPSRIYVNLKGKYPRGHVDVCDYERVRQELKQGLESLTFVDGNRIAKKVYLKEEVYRGSYLDLAPDLIIVSNHGYDLKGRVLSETVFGRTSLQGMHTQDDAFFFNSNGRKCNSILDAKSTILDDLL